MGFPEPKPTRYNGIKFASRLEARWAVLLDCNPFVFRWSYEPSTFTSKETGWTYTPDFLVKVGCFPTPWFLEVKPAPPSVDYLASMDHFAQYINYPFFLCYGDFYNNSFKTARMGHHGTKVVQEFNELILGHNDSYYEAKYFRFDLKRRKR